MSTLIQPDSDQMQLATVMAAFSDPVRVMIIRALAAQGEFACGTLELGVSPATRSHHFRVLREAGITNTRVAGTHRFVSLRRDEFDARFPGLLGAGLAAARAAAAPARPGGPVAPAGGGAAHTPPASQRRAAPCARPRNASFWSTWRTC